MKILALFGGSRRHGNSETLADQVLDGLDCTRIYLAEKKILPIFDQRHDPEGFSPVEDDCDEIIEQVIAHDILIFVTPIYWYSMSAQMKVFVDRWSQTLRDKRFEFRAELAKKQAYVVAVGSDQPRIKGLPMIQQFTYIFQFAGTEFAGYVIGNGNKPGEVLEDARALAEAAWLNQALQAKVR